MEQVRNIIVTHGEDVDGICAATLLISARQLIRCEIIPVSYAKHEQAMQALLNDLREYNGSEEIALFILDLSANNYLFDDRKIMLEISKLTSYLVYFDHHEGTIQRKGELEEMGIVVHARRGISTSSIVCKQYAYHGPLLLLAKFAQIHDFNFESTKDEQQKIDLLQKAISYLNFHQWQDRLVELIKALVAGNAEKMIFSFANAYDQESKTAMQDLMNSLTIRFFGLGRSHVIVFGHASGILMPKGTMRELLKSYDTDGVLGFLVFFDSPTNNALFFHNPETDFDAVPFCQAMGGGGRDGDGGFSISIVRKQFREVVEDLVPIFQEYLEKQ